MKKFLNVMMVLLLTVITGSMVASATGFSPNITIPGTGLLSFIPQTRGVLFMAVQKEIWLNEIIANIFKDNAFLEYATNEDQYVMAGKIVHIPQAGLPSRVKRNRQELPATVTRRKDIDITYSLDEFTTDPRLIENADKVELSYDKLSSVLQEDQSVLTESVAEWMLYHWRPETAEQIIRTTGDSVPAHVSTTTGNRKKFILADLKKAKERMNKLNIPKGDRHTLISTDMMSQLTDQLLVNTNRDYSVIYDQTTGTIKNIEGFMIHERSSVLIASNASTPVVYDPDVVAAEEYAVTSNDVVLCWHKSAVSRAMGTKEMYDSTSNPLYYGDIYSFLIRMGGRKRRADGKGLIAIIQAAA